MATLAFQALGSAIGASVLPNGLNFLGAAVSGAAIGSQIGRVAGSFVDQALFGSAGQGRTFEGPRLEDLRVTTSSEGAPIPRVYGAARVGGQVIWATDFEEQRSTSNSGGQSKGGSFSGGGDKTTTVSYSYFANFAVALAEGEITGLGRVWADGNEWDISGIAHRVYFGSETQAPDALIEAREGAAGAPAYRGTAYIVFERLPLAEFGNRLPQLSFEIFRALDDLHKQIQAAVIIPGSGEFVYATTPVQRREFLGEMVGENVHTREGITDWDAALNQLQRSLPNVNSASLITCWFGDDLRAGTCQVRPGVERREKETQPLTWAVAGQDRASAYVVSQFGGRPAYGGTPSDASVIEAIVDLKARGIKPVLTPFMLMDVPPDNELGDPYTGAIGQPVYPWRGRITVDPAAASVGTVDKTAAAANQIAAFVGTAVRQHFAIANGRVVYSGPDEWSYRRFVLHYAHLAAAAGGVDAFLIGTELRGLTAVRGAGGGYPFVAALVELAADVKAVLGPATKVTYAADWSEYFGHQPADGSGDVTFHLDPLWASPDIDAIGIDLYWPLADWRDGGGHLDAGSARSIYDLDYLKSNLRGGEGFDWYYASDAERQAQVRTPITDGQGKPWIFRYKDLVGWWSNLHYNRPNGVEQATATAWQPQSKPLWLMEIGCPAVDKGANQPNVFYDPKSTESSLPYFARARRDDYMQRIYLQALIEGLDPEHEGYVAGSNPLSQHYGGTMIDVARSHVYAWDARPYPVFPNDEATWGDAPNWSYGHWLNGRIASSGLADLVRAMFDDYGFSAIDVAELEGVLAGYVIDRIMPLREALQPIEMAYFVDTVESGERIVMRHRGRGGPVAQMSVNELVAEKPDAPLLTVTRGQETDLPAVAKIAYQTAGGDYRRTVAEARRLAGHSDRVAIASLAMMLAPEHAQAISETWLHEAWAARRRGAMTLPPSLLAVEPGDMIETNEAGLTLLHRITDVSDHGARAINTLSIEPAIYEPLETPRRAQEVVRPPIIGMPDGVFLDLPLIGDGGSEIDGFVAIHQSPWPGPIAVYRSSADDGYVLATTVAAASPMGELINPLTAAPSGRTDHMTRLHVRLANGELRSISGLALYDGANAMAVHRDDGTWEIIQFEVAELIAAGTYQLSRLLRGQAGTEDWSPTGKVIAAPGSRVVILDDSLTRVPVGEVGLSRLLNWRYGPSNRDIGDNRFRQTAHAFAGVARLPLAPVHVRGQRTAGDLTITWVRRTRRGGDNWEQVDVELGETLEAYEIDIMDGATVRRTLRVNQPLATYSSANQLADFGAVQSSVSCRIYQISATVGRGRAVEAVV